MQYNRKLCIISDSTLPNSLDSLTHFLYCLVDIGRSCTFVKVYDLQRKCSYTATQARNLSSQSHAINHIAILALKLTYHFNSYGTKDQPDEWSSQVSENTFLYAHISTLHNYTKCVVGIRLGMLE